jgi:hypothetical protein
MNRKKIMERVIMKAVRGGWGPPGSAWSVTKDCVIWERVGRWRRIKTSFNDLLFDHDFAKALWGEDGFPGEFTGKYPNPLHANNFNHGAQKGWQYHLQQMVIADDPVLYVGERYDLR